MDKNINFIGDTHGLNIIPLITKLLTTENEKVVLIGDYFDSFMFSIEQQITVFKDLIKLKKLFPNDLTILLGNHDVHYFDNTVKCSGFNKKIKFQIQEIIINNFNLFNVTYKIPNKNVLVSHSGITIGLLEKLNVNFFKNKNYRFYSIIQNYNLSEKINFIWEYEPNHRNIFYQDVRLGHKYSGLIWCRVKTLLENNPKEIETQIVGHTHSKYKFNQNIHFIDCLLYGDYLKYNFKSNEFNIINDKSIQFKKHK